MPEINAIVTQRTPIRKIDTTVPWCRNVAEALQSIPTQPGVEAARIMAEGNCGQALIAAVKYPKGLDKNNEPRGAVPSCPVQRRDGHLMIDPMATLSRGCLGVGKHRVHKEIAREGEKSRKRVSKTGS